MKRIFTGLAAGLLATHAYGTTIAVIDSGTDVQHKDFASRVWTNPSEIPDNDTDDDYNGFVDDINGWNFPAKSNQLINYDLDSSYSDDIKKFFDLQVKQVRGEASADEIQWMKDKIADQSFLKQINTFANYAHGTHVTGITLGSDESLSTIGLKLLPDPQPGFPGFPGQFKAELAQFADDKSDELGPIAEAAFKITLGKLAKLQAGLTDEVGKYIASARADVANGSFGAGMPQAETIVRTALSAIGKGNVPQVQVENLAMYFINEYAKGMKGMVDGAPDTLFVFAAGNDGSNNDVRPVAPANIEAENKITVAATIENNSLASFSNYGLKRVDIAAPGVGIESSIPKDRRVMMNGTSQASPAVAHIAGAVKAANPNLKPVEVKKILMGTVDKKDWLADKVVSGGVANKERAVEAARQSMTMSLDDAIVAAKSAVADAATPTSLMGDLNNLYVTPMPSPFNFSL